jgi:erythromycin esterase-like protein
MAHQDNIIKLVRANAVHASEMELLDKIVEDIGDRKIVMLGESSHGTHEFYTWRAKISQRLIKEKKFNFIAVEGDWPDCYRINRYIKNYLRGTAIKNILYEFKRWPTWMWANWEIAALAEWLTSYNAHREVKNKVGFFGLDVYSLWESLEAIKTYLSKTDPLTLKTAEKAIRCFEPFRDEDGYNYATALRIVPKICEEEVSNMLAEIRERSPHYDHDVEAAFNTEQNAVIAVNAEQYYRAMLEGGASSWNARDGHMQETLDRLMKFHGHDAKAIIWAHNTHIGDAHFTDMVKAGMYNLGQLTRKKYGEANVFLVGFGTHKGSVMAGDAWGAPMREMILPPATAGSWEHILHESSGKTQWLLSSDLVNAEPGSVPLKHRAVGVVYNPNTEKFGNYVPSIIARRYDGFLFIDQTKALHALAVHPDPHLTPETYPFGI